jgi:tRNA pseudouridine55 synthase
MDGILIVDKPLGPTSFDVVARVRRAAGQKRVGHAGTLDPNASGVLVVCLGNATRIVEYLMNGRKGYRATAVFGIETDSEDATGQVVQTRDASHVTREMVERVLPKFTGRIMQIPPMVSAVHHNGERLYDLARKGQVVEREPRPVEIDRIDLIDFQPGANPVLTLDVECSKGTYIRTLCADIGRELGCGGHMSALVRTHVGEFRMEDAVSLEVIENMGAAGRLSELLRSADDALGEMPSVDVPSADVLRVLNGVTLSYAGVELPKGAAVRMHGPGGEFLAIGYVLESGESGTAVKPEKVFEKAESFAT